MSIALPSGLAVYPRSVVETHTATYALARGAQGTVLVVSGDRTGFDGERHGDLLLCPRTPANAAALREQIAWLRPQPLGLVRSAGCGDRLGLATPGHVRALRKAAPTASFAPVFAQQSMRENARTGRTPQQVMDDAMWGVLQEGWHEPWGADADHLKTTADVDLCVAAGYTFFTVDPGDHVDSEAHCAPLDQLLDKVHGLPWDALSDTPKDLDARYLGRQFEVEDLVLEFDVASLARAAAKYGGAVAHTAKMYRHLAAASAARAFELEVSVDETETPTSALEHFYVASELQRLGVDWVSLAPRYVGAFEKGVDYIGDLAALDDALAQHAAIARVLGPYKLSIHSGSDKFSAYPVFSRRARNLVHLKTAGTSYLEALRTIAGVDPGLFREILSLARERFDEDSATYHISADVARVPEPEDLADRELASVLETFDGREVMHVTFGSAVDRFGDRLRAALEANEEAHFAALESHFLRHLTAFDG